MKLNWEDFKTIIEARKLDIIMIEKIDVYRLFTSDGNIEFECTLFKGDTTNCSNFENNYKDACNQEKINKVTPTAPSNDYDLKPYGISHKHIDSSDYVYDITISNKTDTTYEYTCSVTPEYYDCIWGEHGELRDGVLDVDSGLNAVTTFEDILPNGTYKISKPFNIDVKLPTTYENYYLWGSYFSAADFHEDDLVRLQIVDVDNLLGYGANFLIKEYDECWVNQINKLTFIKTPDGAPGEIPGGLYLRIKYYPKDATKTDIKVWVDYAITIKS